MKIRFFKNRKRILRNKKGFTLVELIATITLMGIIAGIAVPSIYYTTSKRQKSAAEYDTQTMYRNSISCISALEALYVTPDDPTPVLRGEVMNDTFITNNWYVEYSKQLARRLYATIVALDIEVLYYDPNMDNGTLDINGRNHGLRVPTKRNANTELEPTPESVEDMPLCTYTGRATMVTAGNKNPYIVIQVIRVPGESYNVTTNPDDYENYLIVSYHNDKNQFATTKDNASLTSTSGAYTTNKDNPIIYRFHIRKSN